MQRKFRCSGCTPPSCLTPRAGFLGLGLPVLRVACSSFGSGHAAWLPWLHSAALEPAAVLEPSHLLTGTPGSHLSLSLLVFKMGVGVASKSGWHMAVPSSHRGLPWSLTHPPGTATTVDYRKGPRCPCFPDFHRLFSEQSVMDSHSPKRHFQ